MNSIRTAGPALALLLLLPFAPVRGGEAGYLGADGNLQTVDTSYDLPGSDAGVGLEQKTPVGKALGLMHAGKLEEADKALDEVLARFATLMPDADRTYVCFARDTDYEQFLREERNGKGAGAAGKVTRVHGAFAQALQAKAFIASARRQWAQALEYLKRKMVHAPYDAGPYIEAGYMLNAQGKPAEALKSYQRGYALTVAHGAPKIEQAVALRGIGCSQIELGQLEEAASTFRKSLELAPNNRVALNELEYIRRLKAGER